MVYILQEICGQNMSLPQSKHEDSKGFLKKVGWIRGLLHKWVTSFSVRSACAFGYPDEAPEVKGPEWEADRVHYEEW